MSTSAAAFVDQNRQRLLDELFEFIRIPSVSTAPEHKGDVRRAAEFVAQALRKAGVENVEIIPTPGHPLVYGDWLHAPGKPTVLCYGHYDVQPPDPLNEWLSPPFEPTLRNGNIYARGAVDDKGQMYMHIKAVEALRAQNGTLPVNLKFLIEGEEEVGGTNIAQYVAKNAAKLTADVALVSDTELFAEGLPGNAAEEFEKVASTAPFSSEVSAMSRYNLATLMAHDGQMDPLTNARSLFEDVLRQRPLDQNTRRNLEIVIGKLGMILQSQATSAEAAQRSLDAPSFAQQAKQEPSTGGDSGAGGGSAADNSEY